MICYELPRIAKQFEFKNQAVSLRSQWHERIVMATTHRSKRFNSNVITEKIVPILLVILLIILLAVFVIIGLSLVGVIPSV